MISASNAILDIDMSIKRISASGVPNGSSMNTLVSSHTMGSYSVDRLSSQHNSMESTQKLTIVLSTEGNKIVWSWNVRSAMLGELSMSIKLNA